MATTPRFLPVRTPSQIATVADLAARIWRQHFSPIIGAPQVEYMLAEIQSAAAITEQIELGSDYYLVHASERAVGYLALRVWLADQGALLSKLYLLDTVRGQGLGRAMLAFADEWCRQRGLTSLWLTVNRENASAIAFYRAAGFTVARELVTDIGGGYVMDDFVMVRPVG